MTALEKAAKAVMECRVGASPIDVAVAVLTAVRVAGQETKRVGYMVIPGYDYDKEDVGKGFTAMIDIIREGRG